MKVILDQIGTSQSLKANLDLLLRERPNTKTIFLLSAQNNCISDNQYIEILKSTSTKILGGIFPQLIYQDLVLDIGNILVAIDYDMKHFLVEGLDSNSSEIIYESLRKASKHLSPSRSLLIWLDGFSPRISDFLTHIYDHFGSNISYVGGGAGRTTLKSSPCIFADQTIHEGKALLISSYRKLHVAFNHGYKTLSGPHLVTKSDKNIIEKIDFKNAFSFYSEKLKFEFNIDLTEENFKFYSKEFPLGIEKFDGTIIIRDPVSTYNNLIRTIGDVPNDSVIYMLKGTHENLIKASEDCSEQMQNKCSHFDLFLVIECVNRFTFLNEKYSDVTQIIRKKISDIDQPLIGVFSLGEIGSDGTNALEFFTKTMVQCGWRRAS